MKGLIGRFVVACALIALLGASVVAQHEHAPFVDAPLAISAAYGSEMALIRLRAAEALYAQGVEDDEIEEVLEGLDLERMRFGAQLSALDAELFERLEEAFEAVEDAVDPSGGAIAEAIPVAENARDVLLPRERIEGDAPFTAAVTVLLLLSQTGVAEGYEEAVEGEIGAYAMGWAALARVQELWQALRTEANETQRFEIEDMLEELEALFPEPVPPSLEGADAEAGEGAAVHIAGFLEDATLASLFPDRDLAQLLSETREIAGAGCDAYAQGDVLLGEARLAWTAFVFDEYLGSTLGMFAPEASETMADELMALVPREVEEEGGEDEEEEEEEEEHEPLDAEEALDRCGPLLDAMDEAGSALGL